MPLPVLSKKKIFIIAGFIAVSIALLYGVIRLFFIGGSREPAQPLADDRGFLDGGFPDADARLPGQPSGRTPGAPTAGQLRVDEVAGGGRTRVLPVNADRLIDPVPVQAGAGVTFYDPSTSYFYRQQNDSDSVTLLTDEKFFSVQSVVWSPDNGRAFIEYPDGSNILYDFTRRQSITLPREVTEPVFTQNSNQLIYKTKSANPDENWLVVSNADGSDVKFVEPLGDRVDQVQVSASPDAQVVAFYSKATGVNTSEVILLGQSGENFKSLDVKGINFKGLYAPDGRRLLYHVVSAANGFNPTLWVTDGRTQTIGLQNFNLGLSTWVDKCTFSSDSRFVYCAVPLNLPEGAGIDPDLGASVSDEFFRIDLDSGFKTRLAVPVDPSGQSDFSAVNIWLSASEDELLFWDYTSGGVYKIRLR